MKTDLATSIVAAIAGIVVAYLAANFLMPAPEAVTFKVLETSASASLDEPDAEIFNFRAVNPTVEVYVGQCLEYNEAGECIDDSFPSTEPEEESEEETAPEAETEENTNPETPSEESGNGTTN